MTIFFIFGAAYLGVGISNVIHASTIASNGVRVRAVVLGVPKDGPSNATHGIEPDPRPVFSLGRACSRSPMMPRSERLRRITRKPVSR